MNKQVTEITELKFQNYNKNYVEKNLIAYIGNKRRLLSLIIESINKIFKDSNLDKKNIKFLDLFAGTGVISRLAKNFGFEVYSNDWEYYSYIINYAFVGLNNNVLNGFEKLGGIDRVIEELNNINFVNEEDKYISTYYCPEDDNNPDIENERLFWTKYNGLMIDGIRAKIDYWYNNNLINNDEKILLIALLLYEASTRSNTSGVFKAFHKGFGGTNHDALSRIMKKIQLEKPTLINGKAHIYNEDALLLIEKLKDIEFDIVYLDPPYNQHQYGSNYHLLNTIAYNDKPPVNKNFNINGKKINKSAIRNDWIKTKSTFCYRDTAIEDFKKLINNINAKKILLSYSTDGIIPFDTILEILSSKGKLDIVSSDYEKFRGGKQSLTGELKNVEFVLMLDCVKKSSIFDIENVKKKLMLNKIEILLKKTYYENRLLENGFIKIIHKNKILFSKYYFNDSIQIILDKISISNYEDILNKISTFPIETIEKILIDLESITDITKEEEIYICIEKINKLIATKNENEIKDIFAKIPYYLSKFNDKKAYIPSLNALISVLKMLNNHYSTFKRNKIFETKKYEKIENIIFKKLNNPDWEKDYYAVSLKKEIGKLYDELHNKISGKRYNSKNIITHTVMANI